VNTDGDIVPLETLEYTTAGGAAHEKK